MNGWRRRALSAVGIGVFMLVWHVAVSMGAQEVRHETFGVALDGKAHAVMVVLDRSRSVAATEEISLAPSERDAAVEKVRVLWGAHQPKLAAVPPGDGGDASNVLAILELAKGQFGGGLMVKEVAANGASGAAGPRAEAEARATELQEAHQAWRRDLPTPAEALAALWEMVGSGVMPRYVIASLFRVSFGFTIAALVGIPFGLALGSFAWVSASTNALIQILRPISPIAWLPVATIMFGGGDQAAVYLIFYCAFFPIAISTAAATGTVELRYRRSAMNFGITGIDLARRLILPAILPSVLTALRVAIGVSWLVVVAAEMLGVESGLGYLVLDARNQVRYDRVVAAMMVIGVIGLAIDTTMRRFEKAELERRGFVSG